MEKKPIGEQINTWSMRFLLGVSTIVIIAGLGGNMFEAIVIGALGIIGAGVMNFGVSYVKAQSLGIPEIQDGGLRFLLTASKLLAIGSGMLALYGLYEYFN